MRFLLLGLVSSLLMLSVSGQVPIPSRPDGYALGTAAPGAPVVLDAFFDLLCPDSKAVWPIVKNVLAAYPSQLYFLLHTFPLPYHTNSFIANQGLHVIDRATQHNVTALTAFTDLFFDQQEAFYNAPTKDQTITQVINGMAAVTEKAGILSAKAFIAGIADVGINEETRISWKYSCSRAVTGTPSFLLNGVYISADASWSLTDWKSVIDSLLRRNAHMEKKAQSGAQFYSSNPQEATSSACPPNQEVCNYEPGKTECCISGESCIPNVGCRCPEGAC